MSDSATVFRPVPGCIIIPMITLIKTPSMQSRDEYITWLQGFMQGVTAMNGMIKGHPRVNGTAFLMKDVGGDINLALADHHRESCARLTEDCPGSEIAEYQFEPAETRSDWISWLHVRLEQSLLPSPINLNRLHDCALVDTRYNVAWHVVDVTCNIAGDFGPPQIHTAKFTRRNEFVGCAYVIPLNDCHLVLRFQTTIKHTSA